MAESSSEGLLESVLKSDLVLMVFTIQTTYFEACLEILPFDGFWLCWPV